MLQTVAVGGGELYTETWERMGREKVWPQTVGEKKRGSAVSVRVAARVRVVFFTEDA